MGTHNYIIKSFEGLNLYFLTIEYTRRGRGFFGQEDYYRVKESESI